MKILSLFNHPLVVLLVLLGNTKDSMKRFSLEWQENGQKKTPLECLIPSFLMLALCEEKTDVLPAVNWKQCNWIIETTALFFKAFSSSFYQRFINCDSRFRLFFAQSIFITSEDDSLTDMINIKKSFVNSLQNDISTEVQSPTLNGYLHPNLFFGSPFTHIVGQKTTMKVNGDQKWLS